MTGKIVHSIFSEAAKLTNCEIPKEAYNTLVSKWDKNLTEEDLDRLETFLQQLLIKDGEADKPIICYGLGSPPHF